MGKAVSLMAEAITDNRHNACEKLETRTPPTSSVVNCNDVCDMTVMQTSLFVSGDGFTVYNANCELVFRVDSYGGHDRDELFLMDASGLCLLTLRRKRPSMHHRWEGYPGEAHDDSIPIFSVKRSSMIRQLTVAIETYDTNKEYLIEGSFAQRNCTFYEIDSENEEQQRSVVAKIGRKVDISTNVTLAKDVFILSVLKPGFDPAFAMGIVLVLDQISDGDRDSSDTEEEESSSVSVKGESNSSAA